MGRKIPGAKHHGVKDPLKQQEQRLKKLKSKINAPPSYPDDQPIPKSLTRLLEFKEKQEQRIKTKKNTQKPTAREKHAAEERSDNPMSSLARLPGESSRSFNLRINSALHSINKRHLQTDEMERSLNPDRYLSEDDAKEERFDYIQRKKLKRKLKEEKKKRTEGETPAKLSRMQKWTLKKKEKKAEKLEEKKESFEPRYERVQFGEVAHEPPSLHVKPRRALTADGAARPGRRDLLLNKLLNNDTEKPESSEKRGFSITANAKAMAVDKKAKQRSLPAAVRMRLEMSQKEAIEAYRSLKANIMKSKK